MVDLAIEPTEQEAQKLVPYLDERKAEAAKVAALVHALIDGKMPSADLLQTKKR